MIQQILTLVSLFFLVNVFEMGVRASPCIAMDASFNLLVFGLGGKDFNAGTQSSWTGNTPAKDITTSGRPLFDGAETTCYLSQFTNAIYVLSADKSDLTSVHIYDVAAASWSTQSVNQPSGSPAFDPANFKTILDRDTNVFYALSNGEVFFLNMGDLKSANATALTWTDVGRPSFDTVGYEPVMALAQNHIHFLGVSGLDDGQANIFVIHFSYFQPEVQSYPANGGENFPPTHGQAASFFQEQAVQQEFAFIPDDGSATYVINVESNTTVVLAGPTTKDARATYFAGITSLVQLNSKGGLSFLPYTQGDDAANAAAKWTKITTVSVPANVNQTGVGADSGPAAGNAQGDESDNMNAAHRPTSWISAIAGAMSAAGLLTVLL